MIPRDIPIGAATGAPECGHSGPDRVVRQQGIIARLQDVEMAGRAVAEEREHAAISGTPEEDVILSGPLRAAAVTAEAGSSGEG